MLTFFLSFFLFFFFFPFFLGWWQLHLITAPDGWKKYNRSLRTQFRTQETVPVRDIAKLNFHQRITSKLQFELFRSYSSNSRGHFFSPVILLQVSYSLPRQDHVCITTRSNPFVHFHKNEFDEMSSWIPFEIPNPTLIAWYLRDCPWQLPTSLFGGPASWHWLTAVYDAGRRTKFVPVKSLDSSEFSSEFSDVKNL